MNINFNELRDKAYKCACDHGFHEKEISDETYLMLIITEISETVNADRKNHHAYLEEFNKICTVTDFGFIAKFEGYIKNSVEDELADVVIRLLDFAGANKLNLNDVIIMQYVVTKKKTFPENMYAIVKDIVNYKYSQQEFVNYAIRQVFKVAEFMGVNLLKHIKLKMHYNELRPYKNGKNY